MNCRVLTLIALVTTLSIVASPSLGESESETRPADTATTRPAPVVEDAQSFVAKVISVEGPAQKLIGGEAQREWVGLEAGDELGELTLVRTGFGAKVILQLADRGEVTINNATLFGIRTLRRKDEEVTARVGIKYGTVRAKVDRAAGPSDMEVATPVAVASLRGTDGVVGFSGDMGMGLKGTDGTWGLRNQSGETQVQAGETSDGDLTPPSQLAQQQRDVQMGDSFGGLNDNERENLRDNGGGRGIIGFTGSGDSGTVPPAPQPEREREYHYEY